MRFKATLGKRSIIFTAFSLMLSVVLLLLFASSTLGETGKWGEEVRLVKKETPCIKNAQGRNPIQFNFSVSVVTPRDYVICMPEMTVQPPDWSNIVYSTSEWSPPDTGEFLCRPNETKSISITITPPFNQLNDTYNFVLRVYIMDNKDAHDEAAFSVVIRQSTGFDLDLWNPPPGGEFRTIPPSSTAIRFILYNTGNGWDRFLVEAELDPPDRGWSIEIVSGVDEANLTPELPPDMGKENPHLIDVLVTMPKDGLAGVTVQVVITITSMFNISLNHTYMFASVTSLQHYGFEVESQGSVEKEGTPGKEVQFLVGITNTGNGWDNFEIKPIWDVGMNPGFIATAVPRTIEIGAREGRTVSFYVTVPEDAPAGAYLFKADVRCSSPELSPQCLTFAVEVLREFGVHLWTERPAMIQTVPGGNLDILVNVTNTGNGVDRFAVGGIEDAPEGWLTYSDPLEVTLSQGQTATVRVVVLIPIRFDLAAIGFHKLTIPAFSTRGDARDDLDVLVEVVQFHRVEWLHGTVDAIDPDIPSIMGSGGCITRSFNPYENRNITVFADIKNFGNGEDAITFSEYSPDPRISVAMEYQVLVLGPDVVRTVVVHISVEKGIPPGLYYVFINATSEGPGSDPRILPIELRIDNVDVMVPPIPTLIDPKCGDIVRAGIELDVGEEMSFKLKVENAGTVPVRDVLVRVYETYLDKSGKRVSKNFFNFTTPHIAVGDRFIVGERPFTNTNPPILWRPERTGNHTLVFRIFYPHQSNTTNDVSRLNVTVLGIEVAEREDTGFDLPPFRWTIIGILIAVLVSVTAVGLNEWFKELKRPFRPR